MMNTLHHLKFRLQRIQAIIIWWQQKELEVRKEIKRIREMERD